MEKRKESNREIGKTEERKKEKGGRKRTVIQEVCGTEGSVRRRRIGNGEG